MKAVVVYESLWGNTAAVARSVAEGIGEGARAVSTAEASAALLADADLVVAGAPTHVLRLPTDGTRRAAVTGKYGGTTSPPDVSQPSMRVWLRSASSGRARCASFDTCLDSAVDVPLAHLFGTGRARKAIARGLERKGYQSAGEPEGFIVEAQEGPLRNGELDRARDWGARLREAVEARYS